MIRKMFVALMLVAAFAAGVTVGTPAAQAQCDGGDLGCGPGGFSPYVRPGFARILAITFVAEESTFLK